MPRPAVIFGGPSPEHDISILSGLQSARALAGAGSDPLAIYWAKTGDFVLVPALLEAKRLPHRRAGQGPAPGAGGRPGGGFVMEGSGLFKKASPLEISAVVNACHGGPGEDGTLQAALDLAGVRYTGPSAPGAALGMDKLAFGGVMATAGVPSLPRAPFGLDGPDPDFPGPYIVKPRFGGSSIGIEITDELASARSLRTSPHFREGAVVEPYLPDAGDLNVSVKTYPELRVSAIEKPLRNDTSGRIYTYAEKYLGGGEGLSGAPGSCRRCSAMRCRPGAGSSPAGGRPGALCGGVPRIDFLWRDDVWVNEINTIPGSMAFYFWSAEGVTPAALLADMLAEATSGPARRYTTEGADGTALRSAGTIAGKLA